MMPLLMQLVLQLQLIFWLIVVLCSPSSSVKAQSHAKPGCTESCGNVTIPYPFGIGGGCYHNKSYEITCNGSRASPKAFLHLLSLEVLEISLSSFDGAGQSLLVRTMPQDICTSEGSSSLDLRGTPYLYSSYNNFVAVGCSGGIVVRDMTSYNEGGQFTGCAPNCPADNGVERGTQCDIGIRCCQALMPTHSLQFYKITPAAATAAESQYACNTTLVALMWNSGEPKIHHPVSTSLRWRFADHPPPSTWHNVSCDDIHECECNPPFEGNPYLPNGCQGDQS